MPDRSFTCPRCSGSMERGFVVDERRNGRGAARWVEGVPEPSIWTGLKLRGKSVIEIVSYRCRRCGYLESYAGD